MTTLLTDWNQTGVSMEFVDVQRRHVVLSNGTLLPIVGFHDADGDPVDDWRNAVTFDFGTDELGFACAILDHDADPITYH